MNGAIGTKQRVLVLSPHTDDGEFGCGGTIARLAAAGAEVYYAAFSLAEESVPPPLPRDILETEVREATARLGITPERLLLRRHRVRHFAAHRQEILEELVALCRDLSPDLVLMPCRHDIHQDHSTIAAEGVRAFKQTSILAYELPWNHLTFATQCFVTISDADLARKVHAVDAYQSQRHRNYAREEFVRGLAVARGTQIGVRYAEAFEVIRWVM